MQADFLTGSVEDCGFRTNKSAQLLGLLGNLLIILPKGTNYKEESMNIDPFCTCDAIYCSLKVTKWYYYEVICYVRKSFYEFLHIVFQQFFHTSHCNILAFYSFSSLFEIRTLCSYEQHFKCTCRNSACKSHEIHQQNCTDSLATAHRNHSFIHLRICFILCR